MGSNGAAVITRSVQFYLLISVMTLSTLSSNIIEMSKNIYCSHTRPSRMEEEEENEETSTLVAMPANRSFFKGSINFKE